MDSAGMIYIARAFETTARTAAERRNWNTDNDPNFWNSPPTWGICRNDLRAKTDRGQTIFFVLPNGKHHPQTIFAYLTVDRVVTHDQAFRLLPQKRMLGTSPDGNILVDEVGRYNKYDRGVHFEIFTKVRPRYVIGDPRQSRFLTPEQIGRKAPGFLSVLQEVLGRKQGATRAIDYISRAGRQELTKLQVRRLRKWVDSRLPRDDRGFGGAERVTEAQRMRCRPRIKTPYAPARPICRPARPFRAAVRAC